KGPTVIAYSGDPVAAPKVAIDFAKANEKFVILGGTMGKTALDTNGVKALAALPSLDELRAKIVGLIQAPATKIAQLTNAPAAKVARVIQAYASKGAAAGRLRKSKSNWLDTHRKIQMADLQKSVDELSKLTVLEGADLAKWLEEKWGVSA